MLVVMSEEQQVAAEAQGVRPSGGNSLMGRKTINPAMPFAFAVPYSLLLQSLSGIWHGMGECREVPTASNVECRILFYWAFLFVNHQKDDSSISCTL